LECAIVETTLIARIQPTQVHQEAADPAAFFMRKVTLNGCFESSRPLGGKALACDGIAGLSRAGIGWPYARQVISHPAR